MADVIDLKAFREGRRAIGRAGTRDPERAEVFPGVSLADLWRLWAACEREKLRDAEPTPMARHGRG